MVRTTTAMIPAPHHLELDLRNCINTHNEPLRNSCLITLTMRHKDIDCTLHLPNFVVSSTRVITFVARIDHLLYPYSVMPTMQTHGTRKHLIHDDCDNCHCNCSNMCDNINGVLHTALRFSYDVFVYIRVAGSCTRITTNSLQGIARMHTLQILSHIDTKCAMTELT